MRECSKCGASKDENEFKERVKGSGVLRAECRDCSQKMSSRSQQKSRNMSRSLGERTRSGVNKSAVRLRNQKKVFEYFLTHPCVDCPESNPLRLSFDHVRGEKAFTIGDKLSNLSWARILQEIEKCDVRCFNCHMTQEARRMFRVGWFFELYGERAVVSWSKYEPQSTQRGLPDTTARGPGAGP